MRLQLPPATGIRAARKGTPRHVAKLSPIRDQESAALLVHEGAAARVCHCTPDGEAVIRAGAVSRSLRSEASEPGVSYGTNRRVLRLVAQGEIPKRHERKHGGDGMTRRPGGASSRTLVPLGRKRPRYRKLLFAALQRQPVHPACNRGHGQNQRDSHLTPEQHDTRCVEPLRVPRSTQLRCRGALGRQLPASGVTHRFDHLPDGIDHQLRLVLVDVMPALGGDDAACVGDEPG